MVTYPVGEDHEVEERQNERDQREELAYRVVMDREMLERMDRETHEAPGVRDLPHCVRHSRRSLFCKDCADA